MRGALWAQCRIETEEKRKLWVLLDEQIFRPALREAVRAPASLFANCVRQEEARDAEEAWEAQAGRPTRTAAALEPWTAADSDCRRIGLPPNRTATDSGCRRLRLPPSRTAIYSDCRFLGLPPTRTAAYSDFHRLGLPPTRTAAD